MSASLNHKQLCNAVDRLILKHGSSNPELLHDLKALQAELAATPSAQLTPLKVTELALKVAPIIKIILDMFGDGDSS